ncbi:hypothetical protein D9757_008693 [Collybiopsis confluens]|uniref:Protein kinase domain-containing protein n=1 Tax=Collybiopsis confluens TaxID=2823264 RepID=A0A8H5H4R1_9AGAR|nr:hypothetical protein D9757_011454 [Collybiopsis confluens]KAF5376395.1 hypothetical protein D9757_008693 [Collybiopsis confluens]
MFVDESLGGPPIEEELQDYEIFWHRHFDWLKDRGYLLRPRYRPGWVASWLGTDGWPSEFEDNQFRATMAYLMDAIRIADGKPVMLRRADPPPSHELEIVQQLLSLQPEPQNHCNPIYEILTIPEASEDGRNHVIVMSFQIPWSKPDFKTVGEVVDFCSQVFEGLEYIHGLNMTHNDVKFNNIMMDWYPLYPDPPHSLRTSQKMDWSGPSNPRNRTLCPVKYHFIDWNLSRQWDLSSGIPPRLTPGYGGDSSVPEFTKDEPCDPFAVDVYCLGNVIREKFTRGDPRLEFPPRRNVKFLEELITDMTQDDPTKRPKMSEVVSRFAEIRKKLSWWKLRSRVSDKRIPLIFHHLYSPFHWLKQLSYIMRRIPAIPDCTRNKGYAEP